MKKIFGLGAVLLVSTMNVNAMPQHQAPFVGINPVMNMCISLLKMIHSLTKVLLRQN